MVAIIVIKLIIGGKMDLVLFLDVVALSSIYSSILGRIASITNNFEDVMDIMVDLDALYPDFKMYHDKYVEETNKTIITKPIKQIHINHFRTSQDPNGRFELVNQSPFTIKSGDKILVHGHTGCGKSTLLYLLTGRITQDEAPIVFSNGLTGYLSSISYQTDKAMANNFVLNEICLNDDLTQVDQIKLIEILRGLRMFDEVLKMVIGTELDDRTLTDEYKVIKFLETRKISEFSSGQIQRLSLAKLLYQLDGTIQLVALDEPFNRLDDETCDACCKFVTDYILRQNRILILATHQVQICRKYCTNEISFTEDLNRSYVNAR
jgi:putative ABC transport system ATP-binding protein